MKEQTVIWDGKQQLPPNNPIHQMPTNEPEAFPDETAIRLGVDSPPIPEKLRKNGFNYYKEQVGIRSCIFRQEVSESLSYFEVFRLKFRPPRLFKGRELPSSFWFPPDEAFGVWAWSHRTLEGALRRFIELEGSEDRLPHDTGDSDSQPHIGDTDGQ